MGLGTLEGSRGPGRDEAELKERAKHVVCKRCGGELTPSLVIYDYYGGAGMELYCPHCERAEYGVEKEIYDMAEYYVENFQFNYFYDMEEGEMSDELNIAKVADMITWQLKSIGLLDKDGLKHCEPDYEKYLERRRRG